MMGIIAWIILGAIAGFIANFIMGSREGLIMTVIVGIVGALIGGFLAGSVLGVADVTGLNIESIIVAVIGAIILIAIVRALTGTRGNLRSGDI
ncbi:MAG TPA: GlsB/YeaQ/YmgE family stress response membrane protein [Candidatus Limnocylindrales bacterium]|nr:GlsB/YeaQ/YmgE family stress response membrane protein [Candidatus Limnocylindrales bacterium]